MGKRTKNWNNGTRAVDKNKIDEYLKAFRERLFEKLEKKGYQTFNSTYEVLGKLDEEKQELSVESHERDLEEFTLEALDCAIVSFWGFVSANEWERKPSKNKA